MDTLGGWLLLYLIGSLPVSFFHAAGVAGRFFDYDPVVLGGIFLALAAPLALIVTRSPSAPAWNIAALWVGALSTALIVGVGVFAASRSRTEEVALGAAVIVAGSISWAAVWTVYFRRSEQVARAFL